MSLVTYEKRGAFAELSLNRPDKLNAINDDMLGGFEAALDEADRDNDVRALIIKGNGRAFSAGFDLAGSPRKENESREAALRRELTRDFDVIMRFWDFPKPTIAAVHGYCLGSAMEITAVCDLTIAAEDSRFGAPEVRFGSGIVCLILPWIIGQKRAREMLLVGNDRIDAQTALDAGLVNRVVPAADLLDTARQLAGEIALNDALAVRLTKQALNRSAEIAGLRQALEEALETDIDIETTETAESRAFNEIVERDGLKAALRWRAAQLPDMDGGS